MRCFRSFLRPFFLFCLSSTFAINKTQSRTRLKTLSTFSKIDPALNKLSVYSLFFLSFSCCCCIKHFSFYFPLSLSKYTRFNPSNLDSTRFDFCLAGIICNHSALPRVLVYICIDRAVSVAERRRDVWRGQMRL